MSAIALVTLMLDAAAPVPQAKAADAEVPKPSSRTVRTVEGWTVRVDDRLLAPPDEAVGRRALQMLESKLVDITFVVPPERLRKLRSVTIVIEMEFFAEMTEAYFGSDDFFPFNRGELKTAEPEIYELMRSVWEP